MSEYRKSSYDIVQAMTQYGLILGFLVSFFASITLFIMLFDASLGFVVIPLMMIASLLCGSIGSLYGIMSGFLSGLAMGLVTHFGFHQIRQPKAYKLTMGVITFIVTLIIFLGSQLWIGDLQSPRASISYSVPTEAWQSMWFMSLVFAVYASQRVATRYLREIDHTQIK